MALLECRDLTRRFGGLVAVDNVSLEVEPGEIRAIIGPNGAGKSTLFNVVTGVLKPSEGRVFFKNQDITGRPVYEVVHKGIARTFQLTSLFLELDALENVRIAAQARHDRRWQFLGGGPVLDSSRRWAGECLEKLNLTAYADVPAGMLSHGDQRLLEIAMALAQKPQILMLDEPTQGLSIEETGRAIEILRGLLAGGGLTVVLVEHDMEVVFKLADKITVLQQGAVIADGVPDAVKADAKVQSAYLGGMD